MKEFFLLSTFQNEELFHTLISNELSLLCYVLFLLYILLRCKVERRLIDIVDVFMMCDVSIQ